MTGLFRKYAMVFLLSMVPVAELRAAIPAGIAWGLNPAAVYFLSVAGNMLPVPFILLFIRAVFRWMRARGGKLEKIVVFMEKKAEKNAEMLYKYKLLGLFILVAIPLPGTGAWTGSLVAAMLQLPIKTSVLVITLGVLAAGVAVMLLTLGVGAVFS